MVEEQLIARGIHDQATLRAMGSVPRERFVPPGLREHAYADGAQSIGRGQTISQPFMVARMTEALGLATWALGHATRPRVLDVGTGSGYQAAVLASLGADVTSVERDPELAADADSRLADLGYVVRVVIGDGTSGAPSAAPFAGIVVGAAAPDVPPPLLEQLEADGRLVLPVGRREQQQLTVLWREGERLMREELESCVFVPLLGRFGYPA